jgi:hypothetical protein
MHSNTIVVSAYGPISTGVSPSCSAYVFEKTTGTNWVFRQKLSTSRPGENWDRCAVAMDNNLVAVGASSDSTRAVGSGAVYVYRRTGPGSSFVQDAILYPTDYKANQHFGSALAIKGDRLIAGAYGDMSSRSYSGAAYIYRRGTSWTQEGKLTNGVPWSEFGSAVAIQTNLVVVGARYDIANGVETGAAYVYQYNGNMWILQKRLSPPQPASHSLFGESLALTPQTLLVGAPWEVGGNGESGAAYLFHKSGTNWFPGGKLIHTNATPAAEFGSAVALGNYMALVGAPGQTMTGVNAGAAYAFDLLQLGSNTSQSWHEQLALAVTATPLARITNAGVSYQFCYWTVDGQPQFTDNIPSALRDILMTAPRAAVAIYLPENLDTDGDGLADWWEYRSFRNLAQSGSGDYDGDRFSNWSEFRAGTWANIPSSSLTLAGELTSDSVGTEMVLRWPSVAGRTYSILRADQPVGLFVPVATGIQPTPPTNLFRLGTTNAGAFFRVQVE